MENKKELRTWLDDMALTHPLVIAGPCSAETEEQVMNIAHQLKDTDVNYYRAGIWKPRTRPGNFEGVGALGLKWLQRVKAETGMKTATEVANKAHVDLALEHDVDLLWIGARSTVSPFIIQEIADALNGTDKIVLIKNPVNPDLSLWLGAVERLYTANIKNLGVIHRGFSTYEKSKYRNIPEWQLAIELQSRYGFNSEVTKVIKTWEGVSIQPKPDTGLIEVSRSFKRRIINSFNPAEARYGFNRRR